MLEEEINEIELIDELLEECGIQKSKNYEEFYYDEDM